MVSWDIPLPEVPRWGDIVPQKVTSSGKVVTCSVELSHHLEDHPERVYSPHEEDVQDTIGYAPVPVYIPLRR